MNEFLNACGISGPLRLAVQGPTPDESGVKVLPQPFAVIGRDLRADLQLDHGLVSRRHAYLQVIEGRAFWIDLESRSGILSDGQVRKAGWLEPGKAIRIGPFVLQWILDGGQSPGQVERPPGSEVSPLVARSHGSLPLPEVALEFLNGPSRSTCWPMNRVMSLVGSAGGCKFRLADPSVSPFHCALIRTPAGLWIVDLLGTESGPVLVNDVPIRSVLLSDQDSLQVGRYRIRIRSRFPGKALEDASAGRRPLVGIPAAGATTGSGFPNGTIPSVFSQPGFTGSLSVGPKSWQEPLAGLLAQLRQTAEPSGLGWISTPAGEPVRLQEGELSASFVVSLVNQFGVMQQQMLDQFQQTVSMLVQMFGNLHQDQMDLVRRELDEIRELSKEFQSLKLDLARRSAAATEPPLPPSASGRLKAGFGIHPGAGRTDLEREEARNRAAMAANPKTSQVPPARPAVASSTIAAGLGVSSQAPVNPARPETAMPATSTSPPLRPNDAAGAEQDRDVIVWLHQRMMTLQQERETRWQRILKLLPGLS
jgi:pSer/pThr/pTyr-binding forkhead associated (FHA) protein